MSEEQLRRIWEELLTKRGLGEFEEVKLHHRSYLRTNYRVTEPDGRERTEEWLINFKGSLSPFEIVQYDNLVKITDFDVGLVITASTITSSTGSAATTSRFVRVYDHNTLTALLREEPEIAEKYGVTIEEVLPKEANTLLGRLKELSPGEKSWREYEGLIEEIFNYLFVPPLEKPQSQRRATNGLEIRDIIFPNHVELGFWAYIRSEYKGSYIVVEAKNKLEPRKNDVVQLSDYLVEKQTGLFGILPSRGISQPAIYQRRKAYSAEPHKMIVLLDDKDIVEMILKKSRGEDSEHVLRDRIDLYRMEYRF